MPKARHSHRLTAFFLAWLGPTATADAQNSVSIDVSGHISPSCGINGAPQSVELGRIDRPGSANLAFTLSCNAPFHYSLSSKNGGLHHTQIAKSQATFTVLVPYQVRLSIPTSRGNLVDTCLSGDIATSASSCAGNHQVDGVAMEAKATLGIDWNFPDQPPLAGAYSDTLTLTLGVTP